MKVGIMQPYFFPYIGYFQLIAAVDLFVIYDNIKYTKKGWINRNRFLRNASDSVFTVPLRKDSDTLDIRDRVLAGDFERGKLANQLREAYRKAPHFAGAFPAVEKAILSADDNLFGYVHGSVVATCEYLGIDTRIVVSSSVAVDPALRAQDRVLATCKAVAASTYINPIGGVELYSREEFASNGVELRFLRSLPVEYRQFEEPFVPWLSIIDVMMFNSPATIRECLDSRYELV